MAQAELGDKVEPVGPEQPVGQEQPVGAVQPTGLEQQDRPLEHAPSKRRRRDLTAAQKRELCLFKQENPKCSHSDVVSWAKQHLDVTIGKSTVGDIVRASDKWLKVEPLDHRLRHKVGQHPKLELALMLWIQDVQSRNLAVTDDMMVEKARKFGADLGIEGLNYSRGWLARFKDRNGICKQVLQQGRGDYGSLQAVFEGRMQLQDVVSSYSRDDIYNMEETALFYQLAPPPSLYAAEHSMKQSRHRVTVALCVNSTGTDKVKPLVVAHASRPRCFGTKFDPELYVTYRHNPQTWMTSVIFHEWVTDLDTRMRQEGRHVLLLLYNASSHSTIGLQTTNVRIHFLPPNTASHIQPMDAGIIQCFKCHYRKQLVQYYIQCLRDDKPQNIDLRQALSMIKHAWDQVTGNTIERCWDHVSILPQTSLSRALKEEEDDIPLAALRDLMTCLRPEVTDPSTYVSLDDGEPTMGEMTDSNIVDIVQGNHVTKSPSLEPAGVENMDSPKEPLSISTTQARSHLHDLITYFETSDVPSASKYITYMREILCTMEIKEEPS